jgi:glycosyltransferase involved in cell wall biosynthesis
MRVLFFGTYDERRHPRVRALRQGFAATGWGVHVLNRPLNDSTEDRVAAARNPLRVLPWIAHLVPRWRALRREAKGLQFDPEVVLVGYLGVFDVVLARLLFRRSMVVLDHMAPLAETVSDRGLSSVVRAVASVVDGIAVSLADVVVVDRKQEGLARSTSKLVTVPLVASDEWFQVPSAEPSDVLRVVFFGLHTPLQGTPTIGRAIALLRGARVSFTMIGRGQDYDECRRLAGDAGTVTWIDWVEAENLPALVASHDVCLGVFGTQLKTQGVVPNKVVQGAAAGCAIVTGDSPPVRRLFGDAAMLVPVGDAEALADSIRLVAQDREMLATLRAKARAVANARLRPSSTIEPLLERLGSGGGLRA